jgi:hypothetical protein
MRIAVLLAASLAVLTGVLRAQSDDDDEEMDYYPLVPSGNLMRFGLHFVGGPKVTFGQLGSVPPSVTHGDTTIVGNRLYDDGSVSTDTRVAPNGGPINDGLTNTWAYNFASQVTPSGDIAFHTYSTTTLGGSVRGKSSSAAGWELQMGHRLAKLGGKVDFNLVAGFSFSDVNAKKGGTVRATLDTLTDTYSLNGQTPPDLPFTGTTSTSRPVVDANGNPVLNADGSQATQTVTSTVLLGNLPVRSITAGTVDVKGLWQIKGAYYTFRLGPMLEIPLTERLKLSFGAGAALVYFGSRYIAHEEVDITDVSTAVQTDEESDRNVMLPLYYANADAEYWLTERTGLYLGASYQKSGHYDQTLNGRTATIDLGSTYGISSGITLRF